MTSEEVGSCWIQFSLAEGTEIIQIFGRKYAKGTEIRGVHLNAPNNIDPHTTIYYMGKMTRSQVQKIVELLSSSEIMNEIVNSCNGPVIGRSISSSPSQSTLSSVTLLELMSLGTGDDAMIGVKIECDIWDNLKNLLKQSFDEMCLICPSISNLKVHNENRTPHISLFAYGTKQERDLWLKKLLKYTSVSHEISTMYPPKFGSPVLVFKTAGQTPLEKYIL